MTPNGNTLSETGEEILAELSLIASKLHKLSNEEQFMILQLFFTREQKRLNSFGIPTLDRT